MEYSGTGINDTEYQALKVIRIGKAEEYVVEIRLNFQWLDFNGGFAFARSINRWLDENPECEA